jgi:choline-sulfatase
VRSEDKPNILLIQADQLAAPVLPMYGGAIVRAPHIQALASSGVVFDNAYCNFPLCAPSRFSMMAGQLASRIQAFDNGAEFPAAIPTMAHYLRFLGYRTCLSGKMHFVGPDQLHGFEERLTTDIYPSDFIWTAEWEAGGTYSLSDPNDPTPRGGMRAVQDAGVRARTMQRDYDDASTHHSVRWIYDVARDGDSRPFFHLISLTHPHDPYTTTPEYWNRYRDEEIELPQLPAIPRAQRDPMTARLFDAFGIDAAALTPTQIRAARRAYYASISYVDDRIGELLAALDATRLRENTIIVITSDHGEMLGERGLWYKRSFFEWSVRVPLIFSAPGRFPARHTRCNVSLVDLLPTFTELGSNGSTLEMADHIDGSSLVRMLTGSDEGAIDVALSEVLCEGTTSPAFMIKRGAFKYVHCDTDPPQLFDCVSDPDEQTNLAGVAAFLYLEKSFVV